MYGFSGDVADQVGAQLSPSVSIGYSCWGGRALSSAFGAIASDPNQERHTCAYCQLPLNGSPAAVDQKGVAGDEGGRGRSQKYNGASDIGRFPYAMQGRNVVDYLGTELGIG